LAILKAMLSNEIGGKKTEADPASKVRGGGPVIFGCQVSTGSLL